MLKMLAQLTQKYIYDHLGSALYLLGGFLYNALLWSMIVPIDTEISLQLQDLE